MDKIQQAIERAERAALRSKQLGDRASSMTERQRKRIELEKAILECRAGKQRHRDVTIIDKQFGRIRSLNQLSGFVDDPSPGRDKLRKQIIAAIRRDARLVAEAQARLMEAGIAPMPIDYPQWLIDPTNGSN